MANQSKRMKAVYDAVDKLTAYPIKDALELVKSISKVKFDESIDISVNLGVDARKSDQVVRGATVLPHGTGKKVRVAVFAQGPNAEKAKAAGADIVGFDDLADQVKQGQMDFDVVIATPDSMAVVGKLGTILGPRGLMPNPKVGTVTADVEKAVKNAKAGQVRYRIDKGGIIHCLVGKVSFTVEQLYDNIVAIIADLVKAKPTAAKGVYLRKISLSSTMGPGIVVDVASIDVK